MKTRVLKIFLFIVSVCLLATACATAEEETFDVDFNEASGPIDLSGFNMVYEFGSNVTENIIDENMLGYTPNTIFSDLAYQRLEDVKSLYNCDITVNYTDNYYSCRNFVATSIAATFMCDAISGISDMWADVARTGMLVGMSELSDFIDYKNEDKWGNRSLLEVVYYNDDLYGLLPMGWPELNHSSFGYPIAVNEDLVAEMGQTDPREYVENGTWTWDTFKECLVNYTKIEGTETVHYGLSAHTQYFAEMFARSNGDSLVKKNSDGTYSYGFDTTTAIKAMEEANNIYYGDYAYTIEKTTAGAPADAADVFVEGRTVMTLAPTGYIYGQDARISLKVDNFGILTFPTGPDVEPGHIFSIMENNNYCIAISRNSRSAENTALIIDAIYEPLPGYETFDDIKNFMEHNYFFDPRDCDNFFNMYLAQEYNYFHYNIRTFTVGYLSETQTITQYLDSTLANINELITEHVLPSVRGIEAVWGTYD